jgi:uncharacterized SAM-binding protein YcdF (DUF218 family)
MSPAYSEHSRGPLHPEFYRSREAISAFLFISDEPQAVDLCVVLGAPSPTNIDPAIALYEAGFTRHIVITGSGPAQEALGAAQQPAEYQILRERALAAGVPESVLVLETTATNTLENFTRTATLIEQRFGWNSIRSVAIAGKPLHMRRAQMTARRYWPEHLKLVMQPTTSPIDLQADTWWRSETGRDRVLSEIRKIGEYALAADLGGF